MSNEKTLKQYVFIIHKLRQVGGINYSKPFNMRLFNKAADLLIEIGYLEPCNRHAASTYIRAHIAYEGDLVRFYKENLKIEY